ncbi:MAG: phosphoglucosamine mutase [Desulfobacterales bacterium]|nr:phosphoglucosamine mutase [Desulfobacterales bacterium]
MGDLFGTDGIRGEANQYPMDGATAFAVGQAVSHFIKNEGQGRRVIIGKDTRISGPMLEHALKEGIASMGADPCSVGVLPTPGVAFITKDAGAGAGIMISASHNPYQDNGLKIFSADGFKLSDGQEQLIEDLILKGNPDGPAAPAGDMGTAYEMEDARTRYSHFLTNSFPSSLSMKGIKIVIDTANGATYEVAPNVFDMLGADTEVIHNRPDGRNINENCGSQFVSNLQDRVVEEGAALGLAFDGDGDRLIAVDEKGGKISGDQILFICAMALKDQGGLQNDLVVSTVMSNLGLRIACEKHGLRHYASQVGDRYVLQDMQRLGAVLGGEPSGHMIFLNHHTTGDGVLSAIQLIAAMIMMAKPLSEPAALVDIYPQKVINVEVTKKPDISTLPRVVEAIKQVETDLGDQGRVLVRYSGTRDLCRVMVEGPTHDQTGDYCGRIAGVIRDALGVKCHS